MPKSDRIWRHLGIAFAFTLGLYLIGFSWVEHRRTRLGPWEVGFAKELGAAPLIQIDHRTLRITNVRIRFHPGTDVAPTNARVDFVPGREVPFPVPFGECVFMDPLFLPGTVTLELFGHRLEMLPRALTIDGQEREWKSDSVIDLNASP